ncbi:MAG TPA: GspH/FimT family pseudopilin [Rhodocyclaceae bacterium]
MKRADARQAFKSNGFTLLEMIAVIAILAILLRIAVPALQELVINQRVRGATMDTLATLMLARSEAIKQGGNVSVTPASGTTNWSSGWRIVGTDGATVRTQDAYSGVQVSATISTGAASVVFDRTGRISGTATMQIESASNAASYARRCVSVGLSGQPKSTTGVCS